DVAPAGERPPEAGLRLGLGARPALARERGPRHESLEAAVVRAVARARRPGRADDDVAELAGRARGAADDTAVGEDPAPDAGPDREHDDVARPARRAVPPLGKKRRGGVVVDDDGQ